MPPTHFDGSRTLARSVATTTFPVKPPFRAACLQQAFAALLMLRRRDLAATVHLGLARDASGTGLEAHAWSRNGEVPVTGAAVARRFASVATFAA